MALRSNIRCPIHPRKTAATDIVQCTYNTASQQNIAMHHTAGLRSRKNPTIVFLYKPKMRFVCPQTDVMSARLAWPKTYDVLSFPRYMSRANYIYGKVDVCRPKRDFSTGAEETGIGNFTYAYNRRIGLITETTIHARNGAAATRIPTLIFNQKLQWLVLIRPLHANNRNLAILNRFTVVDSAPTMKWRKRIDCKCFVVCCNSSFWSIRCTTWN